MIGVYGGTFDPIHYGHLQPVTEVYRTLNLAKVLYVTAGCPPHRRSPQADAIHRHAMVNLALKDHEVFLADDRELHRECPSYTIDTLRAIKRDYKSDSLCLIVGADAYAGLAQWQEVEAYHELCNIAVMQRESAKPSQAVANGFVLCQDRFRFAMQSRGHVFFAPTSLMDISASEIRRAVSAGHSIEGKTPKAVSNYIKTNQLYK